MLPRQRVQNMACQNAKSMHYKYDEWIKTVKRCQRFPNLSLTGAAAVAHSHGIGDIDEMMGNAEVRSKVPPQCLDPIALSGMMSARDVGNP